MQRVAVAAIVAVLSAWTLACGDGNGVGDGGAGDGAGDRAGGSNAGDTPTFDTALLTGRGEVELVNLWDFITDDCQREGVQGMLPSGTLVGVTLVRNDCDPKMYFVGTGREGENGWVSEDFLDPR